MLFDFVFDDLPYKTRSWIHTHGYENAEYKMLRWIDAFCKNNNMITQLYTCSESRCVISMVSIIEVCKVFTTCIIKILDFALIYRYINNWWQYIPFYENSNTIEKNYKRKYFTYSNVQRTIIGVFFEGGLNYLFPWLCLTVNLPERNLRSSGDGN